MTSWLQSSIFALKVYILPSDQTLYICTLSYSVFPSNVMTSMISSSQNMQFLHCKLTFSYFSMHIWQAEKICKKNKHVVIKSESHSVMSDSLQPHGLYSPWNSPGQNTGVRSLFLLQGIFPTERPNPGLPHCKRILYQLSHKGSPRILEWVAYPFSSRSSQPRNRTRVSCIAGGFFTNWAIG